MLYLSILFRYKPVWFGFKDVKPVLYRTVNLIYYCVESILIKVELDGNFHSLLRIDIIMSLLQRKCKFFYCCPA